MTQQQPTMADQKEGAAAVGAKLFADTGGASNSPPSAKAKTAARQESSCGNSPTSFQLAAGGSLGDTGGAASNQHSSSPNSDAGRSPGGSAAQLQDQKGDQTTDVDSSWPRQADP